MHAHLVGIFLPDVVIRLHLDALEPVQRHDVEFMHGVVVFRRVACRHHNPAVRHAMPPEYLVLQELQHDGGEGLRYAVDFIQKQDALTLAGGLHQVIDGGDDFAHGVFGDVVFHAVIHLVRNERQPQRTLARVVRHGVGEERHVQLLRNLLYDRRLADAWRADEKHRALPLNGDDVIAHFILGEIRRHGVLDLLLGLLDVHRLPFRCSTKNW